MCSRWRAGARPTFVRSEWPLWACPYYMVMSWIDALLPSISQPSMVVRTAQAATSYDAASIFWCRLQAGYVSTQIPTSRYEAKHQVQERQPVQAEIAYKILTAGEFEQWRRDGLFLGSAVDIADGYIHLSTGAQVAATLAKHFSGIDGLMIAAVDLEHLGSIRWEPSRGGDLFPHVYGTLPFASVVAAAPVAWTPDGVVRLPASPTGR